MNKRLRNIILIIVITPIAIIGLSLLIVSIAWQCSDPRPKRELQSLEDQNDTLKHIYFRNQSNYNLYLIADLHYTDEEIKLLDNEHIIIAKERNAADTIFLPAKGNLPVDLLLPIRKGDSIPFPENFSIKMMDSTYSGIVDKFDYSTFKAITDLQNKNTLIPDYWNLTFENKMFLFQTGKTFNKNEANMLPSDIIPHIPYGYITIALSEGYLNEDKIPDLAIVLKKADEEKQSDMVYAKPLMIFLGKPGKQYELIYRNDNAIWSTDRDDRSVDPFKWIQIQKGNLIIEHSTKGKTTLTTIFKYEPQKSMLYLYRNQYTTYKQTDSYPFEERDLIKIETTKDFGIIPFNEYNIYRINQLIRF